MVYLWQRLFDVKPFKLSDPFEMDAIFDPTATWISEIMFETRLWDAIYIF